MEVKARGQVFTIQEDAADDWELVECMEKSMDGNFIYLKKGMNILLGDSQIEKMKEVCRDENGKVKTSEMFALFTELMNSSAEVKNS